MSFTATDPASHKGKTNTWLTPLQLIKELGEFDLDPCAYPGHNTAKKLICLPDDGLDEKWIGRVWLNPPYGEEQRVWLNKLYQHRNGIALVFARLETRWIQPFIKNGFFIIEGRISFMSSIGNKETNAGTGSILSSELKGKWFQ